MAGTHEVHHPGSAATSPETGKTVAESQRERRQADGEPEPEKGKGLIDFSERVERVFRKLGMQRQLEKYARKRPERFLELFVQPLALRQMQKAEEDEAKREQRAVARASAEAIAELEEYRQRLYGKSKPNDGLQSRPDGQASQT